jgi:formylglycine-generating enzyme required for sulfatase activity
MAHEVFLSYSGEEQHVAERVCAYLEGKGLSCWLSARDILEGQDRGAAIAAAIQSCRVVVLIFSSAANRSKQVARELKLADDAIKRVVPVRIENISATGNFAYFLGAAHWLDAIGGPREADLDRLSSTLRNYVEPAEGAPEVSSAGDAPKQIAIHKRQRRPPRYGIYLGSGLGLLLVAAVWWSAGRPSPAKTINAGTIRANPGDRQQYVWIPKGSFREGCSDNDSECTPDEKPAHAVTITRGFWMGRTEVTVGAYREFSQQTGRLPAGAPFPQGDDHPVVGVSWHDADAYCNSWARGRLPTEAEWEYAARAGTNNSRYGDLDAIAWHQGNSRNVTHPAGQKKPNAWGLYDMLGSVWEWCSDWAAPYSEEPATDPQGPPSGVLKVGRGGSYFHNADVVRVSVRGARSPEQPDTNLGFRCVRETLP